MTSTSDWPMFPAAIARRPLASRIEASINVVVVLPFVPVMVSHGASSLRSLRSCQANSSSPQMGMPAFCAAITMGASGDTPGERTNSSASGGNVESSPRMTVAPKISKMVARSRVLSDSEISKTVTTASL
ncbi:unannotated protein [freshwater metagenome]|uniref:Unannotated protein n=1 Tax=freshwater metagenome TaxID=449393 RepID=A0A6J5ZQF8_9ZZZZ